MRTKLLLFALLTALSIAAETQLTVLQLNLWVQGDNVPGGKDAIAEIIDSMDPDVVLLCETGGKASFPDFLLQDLAHKGKTYYADTLGQSMGILSKIKPDTMSACFTIDDRHRPNPVCKFTLSIGKQKLALYSVHLDWTHYECYMPRDYSGTTWEKLSTPVCDADSVLAANRQSLRDEAISLLIADADAERRNGALVILGWDFNEPSHLDWQDDTKDLRDHNGLVIDWDCSVMLQQAGYRDSYREKYPDAVLYPGFTFPAGNRHAELQKLVWLPDKDERDRIDFIYYSPGPKIELRDVVMVGPAEDIVEGRITVAESGDSVVTPHCIWPSDHRGTFCTFVLSDDDIRK